MNNKIIELRIEVGRLNELEFCKNLDKYFIDNSYNIEIVKSSERYYPIDFILTKVGNTFSYIELKSRMCDTDDIELLLSYSKIQFVKAFEMKNVIIVWWVKKCDTYYYLLLTDEVINILLNETRSILKNNLRTLVIDRDLVSKSNNIDDIGKFVVGLSE